MYGFTGLPYSRPVSTRHPAILQKYSSACHLKNQPSRPIEAVVVVEKAVIDARVQTNIEIADRGKRPYVGSFIQFGTPWDVFFLLSRLLDFGKDIYLRHDKWRKVFNKVFITEEEEAHLQTRAR